MKFVDEFRDNEKAQSLKREIHALAGEEFLISSPKQLSVILFEKLGLPILILRESGVIADGILEQGVAGVYMPEFDLTSSANQYFKTAEWRGIIGKWEGYVRAVVESKGTPPRLY